MKNEQPSVLDLIVETHVGLERQGPGSPEMTIKALTMDFHAEKRTLNISSKQEL